MRFVPRWRSIGAVALALACASEQACSSEPAPPAERPAPASPAEQAEEAEAGDAAFDLLPSVARRLAVSSTTPSLQSGPDYLVDGQLSTSWASRTGDEHPTIAVLMPPEARVQWVEMTAGFTHREPDHDRFTENLRIRRVRIEHEDRSAEFSLDPERRDLQRLEFAGRGGVYEITILETEPGTRPSYREVCVSELRMMGVAPGAPMESPELVLGGAEQHQSLERIREARATFFAHPDSPEAWNAARRTNASGDRWLPSAELLMDAMAMRCPLPELRAAVIEAHRDVESARAEQEDALQDEVRGDCPEGIEGDECEDFLAEEAAYAEEGHDYVQPTASDAWTRWVDACSARLAIPEDVERATDEQRRFLAFTDTL